MPAKPIPTATATLFCAKATAAPWYAVTPVALTAVELAATSPVVAGVAICAGVVIADTLLIQPRLTVALVFPPQAG